MHRGLRIVLAFALLLVALIWVARPAHKDPAATTPATPQVIVDLLDPSLEQFAVPWEQEIGRRFPHSVAVLCHGIGGGVKNEWLVAPFGGIGGVQHIDTLIAREKALYPDRTLVILCCNVQHDVLHGYSNVFYAPSSVWCIPDRSLELPRAEANSTLDNRFTGDPDATGNVFEFISAE